MNLSDRLLSSGTVTNHRRQRVKRRRLLLLEHMEERRLLANFGFEDPIMADGLSVTTGVAGWQFGYYDVNAPNTWVASAGDSGVWNPDAADGFTGGAAYAGENSAWAKSTATRDVGLRQLLGTNLEANNDYIVSVQVGNPSSNQGNATAAYRLELFAGGVLLQSDAGAAPAADSWASHGFTYSQGASHAQLGQPLEIRLIAERYSDGGGMAGYEVNFDEVAFAIPIEVPNAGFEAGALAAPFEQGQDKYVQASIDTWRHFEVDNNGGPLRIWNPGNPAVPGDYWPDARSRCCSALDVGFGGNAPEGELAMLVRSRYNDNEFHVPPQVRDFEAAVQLLEATFDPTMTYTLTAQVGRLPANAGEGGSDNYDANWFGYSLQLAVGGTNVDGARYASRVQGGTIVAEDLNTLTVSPNGFVTSTVTYTPDPADANLAGLPLQIRLAALEDPNDHSLVGWAAFDDVQLFLGAVDADVPSDTTPPVVSSFEMNVGYTDPANLPKGNQPSSWAQQRGEIYNIELEFSEDVTLDVDDLRLTNLGLDATLGVVEEFDLQPSHFNLAGNVVTLTFAPRELDSGVYRIDVLPTATDLAGNAIDGDGNGTNGDEYSLEGNLTNKFYKLSADWSGDEGVSVFDFSTFTYWFGSFTNVEPAAPIYADFNDDQGISVFDFTGFSDNFGAQIVYVTAFAGTVANPSNAPIPADEIASKEQVVEIAVTDEMWGLTNRHRIIDNLKLVDQPSTSDELDLELELELEAVIDVLASDIADAMV